MFFDKKNSVTSFGKENLVTKINKKALIKFYLQQWSYQIQL